MAYRRLSSTEMLRISRPWITPGTLLRRLLESLPETARIVPHLDQAHLLLVHSLGRTHDEAFARARWLHAVNALTTTLPLSGVDEATMSRVVGPLHYWERAAERRAAAAEASTDGRARTVSDAG